MPDSLKITAATPDPSLLDLPWSLPLVQWPAKVLAALPRGISRHVVRFVKLSGRIIAVKEISEEVAYREYKILRELERMGAPTVRPSAVITGRTDSNAEPLNCALVTEHLQYSLPYRALFSKHVRPETATRLIDSLAVLLVRLHLQGFYWGDVSLSNTLFRRDAGAFAAYLVDAETGELHPQLTSGQRNYDVDLGRTNIIGELMDLQAGQIISQDVDVIAVGTRIQERYCDLWDELTAAETFRARERWRVSARINRLKQLGFDVGELTMISDENGSHLRIQPKVVDAGHYHRQVMRLTGLDVEEGQGQRMINDLETYRAMTGRKFEPIELTAHAWLREIFEPTIEAIPASYRAKLEPAQIFHEVLDHRWFLSEAQDRDVPTSEAVLSYIANVLPKHRDEQSLLDYETSADAIDAPLSGMDLSDEGPSDANATTYSDSDSVQANLSSWREEDGDDSVWAG